MRIGFNPNKDKPQKPIDFFHQVIIPVHIPNQEGYFRDSFKIFKYSLESLFKTSHSKTYFTIVNNGSCDVVISYLNQLQQDNKIQEVVHTTAIGKINAILKGLTGHKFELITISDADVLFVNNWQKATYEVFNAFAKVGAVSTTPSSKVLKQHTSNVITERFFSSKLGFAKVLNSDAMKMFAKSIRNENFYNEIHLKRYLTIQTDNTKAVVGAGHFVATYKGAIFEKLKKRYSLFSLGGGSISLFLDEPVADKGYWRLSTEENLTYHMGNVFESWMHDVYSDTKQEINEINIPTNLSYKPILFFIPFNKLFFRVLSKRMFWKFFLRYKGLTKSEAQNY